MKTYSTACSWPTAIIKIRIRTVATPTTAALVVTPSFEVARMEQSSIRIAINAIPSPMFLNAPESRELRRQLVRRPSVRQGLCSPSIARSNTMAIIKLVLAVNNFGRALAA